MHVNSAPSVLQHQLCLLNAFIVLNSFTERGEMIQLDGDSAVLFHPDELLWHISDDIKHFSLMCLKAVSQNGGAGIIFTIAIIDRHRPGEPRHYCWSMTFKVHDRSHETCFVRHEQFLCFQHTGANALLCIILHRLRNTCFIPAISRTCTLWGFLSTASIYSVIH